MTQQKKKFQKQLTNKVGNQPDYVVTDRMPPQSIEAEMGVLGSMMLSTDVIGDVLQLIREDSFYLPEHVKIYFAIISLYEANKPIDMVLLRDELDSRGDLNAIGGVEYLVRIAESVPSAASAEYYAHIVNNKGILRNLISVTTDLVKRAYENIENPAEFLEEVEQKIFQVTEQKISSQAVAISEILGNVFEKLENHTEGLSGISTGYFELDEILSGLQKGEMTVLAARPSMGKTALGLNICEYIAADDNRPVAFFSIEMAAMQLAERMLCGRAHVDGNAMRQGKLNDDQYAALTHTCGQLSEARIYVDDSPHLSPLELRAKARRLKMRYDIECIIIDYMQLMHCPGADNRAHEVGMISRHIKALARELNIPVVVLAQLNRGPEDRGESKRPRMSDLRESGNIEQDADVILLLHREDYYKQVDPDYERTNTAEIIIAKQRNGPTGTIKLKWTPNFTRFDNMDNTTDPFGL
jgi:replicative DNA helicase